MNWQPDQSPALRGAAARSAVWLAMGALVVFSCMRVPGTIRSKVTVRGRVFAGPGEPLPGATLTFQANEIKFSGYAETTTDSSGAYSVQLILGNYRVAIQPGGGFLSRTEWVTVSSRHPWTDFSLGGHRVSGKVFGGDGALVDSGRVFASLSARPNAPSQHAHSSIEKGNYSFRLPDGRYSIQAVPASYWSGLYPARKDSVSILADTAIDLQMGGISVSGRVVGPDGLPLKGAGVEVLGQPVRVRAGDDGRYQLYLPSGSYRLQFQCSYPFFMPPRTIGPLTITQPTTMDMNFSGVEWKGRVLRTGTNELPPEVIVLVKPHEDTDGRAAAIGTGPKGEFRFVLEKGRRYDLEAYDRATRESMQVTQGMTAGSDTTFEVLLPPTKVTTRADSTIVLSIRPLSKRLVHYVRPKRYRSPALVEVTLRNDDPDTVTLVLPGDGSDVGWRTPLVDWDVETLEGRRVERQMIARCGNINPLRADEVFTLPPGGEKKFTTAVPYYYRYEKSRRYLLRLTYENRPHLSWGGAPLGSHDPAAKLAIRNSTRCKLVSNALEIEVK